MFLFYRKNAETFRPRRLPEPFIETYEIITRGAPFRPRDGGGKLERVGSPQGVTQQNLPRDSTNLFYGLNFVP